LVAEPRFIQQCERDHRRLAGPRWSDQDGSSLLREGGPDGGDRFDDGKVG